MNKNWAVIIPVANEEADIVRFADSLKEVFNKLGSGTAFFIVDNVSKDNTLTLCYEIQGSDSRFITVFSPENRNVVDAYIKGYRTAYEKGFEFIIEMDAGFSHDPLSLPDFLSALEAGYDCVFGSRFVKGGSMGNSPFKRRFLSKFGTVLSNTLLGTRLKDMTSGFQGFRREIVGLFLKSTLGPKRISIKPNSGIC